MKCKFCDNQADPYAEQPYIMCGKCGQDISPPLQCTECIKKYSKTCPNCLDGQEN